MNREKGPGPEEISFQPKIERKETLEPRELTEEEKHFVEKNPELKQITMLEGAEALVEEGVNSKNHEMVREGLEILNSARENVVVANPDDSPRTNIVKRIIREFNLERTSGSQSLSKVKEDTGQFFTNIRRAPKGEKLRATWEGSLDYSRKHGILGVIDKIRNGINAKN